jgi:hypothetical protein
MERKKSGLHPQGYDIITAAWGNGRFIAVGERGGLAMSDSYAENWVILADTTSGPRPSRPITIYSIIYANEIFMGVGDNGKITTSPDGISWTDRTN